MVFHDESPTRLRLIGYQTLTNHGLALPVFGAARNPNTHYCALCEPFGDVYGKISGFVEISAENFIPLTDDRIWEAPIGSPWLSVFLWDNQAFVGPADEIWKTTATYRKAIAKDTPLSYLALTEFDPAGKAERKASRAAYRWLSKQIGDRQALSWYKDSYLRGAMIRLIRSVIQRETVPSHSIEQKLNSIRVHWLPDRFYFEIPDDSLSLSQEQLREIAMIFETKTGQNFTFKVPPFDKSSKKLSVRDKLLGLDQLPKIVSAALDEDRNDQSNPSQENHQEQVSLRAKELSLVDPKKDPQKWITLQTKLGYALLQLGKVHFRSDALERSIAVFKSVLEFEPRIRTTKIRAFSHTCIGEALKALGERASGSENLAKAVAAYRSALKQWSRDQEPLDWAAAQNDLGAALQTLGEREGNTERLYEAVAAYRAALEERTRERVPHLWASTQNNLGAALWRLGESEGDDRRIMEAISAYRSSLEERTQKRAPLAWAMTQNNLGAALSRLGERRTGTELLKDAVAALRSALEERTRDRVPLDWANTQNNLGNALRLIGERENNVTRLEEAIIAYRAALEEYTRDRVPLDWAMVQNNLGVALQAMGKGGNDTAWLSEAIAAYRAALEERTRDRAPLDWAGTQNNLGNALSLLGERELGTTKLEQSIVAYCLALEERRRDKFPLDWAITTENLAIVEDLLGDKLKNADHWRKAIYLVEAALQEYRTSNATFYVSKANELRDNIAAKLSL
jgi:tetratricopeptide (TPR) repeat protein